MLYASYKGENILREKLGLESPLSSKRLCSKKQI